MAIPDLCPRLSDNSLVDSPARSLALQRGSPISSGKNCPIQSVKSQPRYQSMNAVGRYFANLQKTLTKRTVWSYPTIFDFHAAGVQVADCSHTPCVEHSERRQERGLGDHEPPLLDEPMAMS